MVTKRTLVTMKASAAKSIPAGEFKAKCLALLDEVEGKGRTFVVTKRGRPVARVVPLEPSAGSLEGSLLDDSGLLDPSDDEWEAER